MEGDNSTHLGRMSPLRDPDLTASDMNTPWWKKVETCHWRPPFFSDFHTFSQDIRADNLKFAKSLSRRYPQVTEKRWNDEVVAEKRRRSRECLCWLSPWSAGVSLVVRKSERKIREWRKGCCWIPEAVAIRLLGSSIAGVFHARAKSLMVEE